MVVDYLERRNGGRAWCSVCSTGADRSDSFVCRICVWALERTSGILADGGAVLCVQDPAPEWASELRHGARRIYAIPSESAREHWTDTGILSGGYAAEWLELGARVLETPSLWLKWEVGHHERRRV